MPAPKHYRVTMRGVLGPEPAPTEIWSFGLTVTAGGNPFLVRADLPALATSLFNGPLFTFLQAVSTDQVRADTCRIALVEDGKVLKQADGAFIQGDSTGPAGRPSGGSPTPFSTALVVSTQSAAAGPTGRGRFYIPCPRFLVGADGILTSAQAVTVANAAQTMVNGVNTTFRTANASATVVVASGGSAAQGIAPALRPVTSIRVGRVLDHLQTRRNALLEQYTSRAIS